jgi:hypothetical protein
MRRSRETTQRTRAVLVVLCLLAVGGARAQTPEQNERVVRAEAPIVAGNAVNAKKRALADAFRQIVEKAFGELVKEGGPLPSPLPVGLAQLKASLANSAQKFVRSYRLIEQETDNGVLRVMVEADVDAVLLRRELERARGAAVAPVPAVAPIPAAANFLLVAGTAPVAAMLAGALTAAGVSARLDASPGEAQLVASAAKQNAYALFVVATSAGEGMVRGTNRISLRCVLRSRLFSPGPQALRGPSVDRTEEDRGFSADGKLAGDACFEKVSSRAARELVSALRAPSVAAAFVTLQLDIVNPGAIPTLLQALKRVGAVTATEVRHVAANLAELRVFTRIGGAALGQALLREVAGKLTVAPTQTTNDLLVLRVRALDPSAPEENR